MDYLWTPWRYQYVQKKKAPAGCVLCQKAAERNDDANFLVYRGEHNFIVLNLYPYTTGHLMIAPYQHVATLDMASAAALQEMILLAQQAQHHLGAIYKPDGFNLGMNL